MIRQFGITREKVTNKYRAQFVSHTALAGRHERAVAVG